MASHCNPNPPAPPQVVCGSKYLVRGETARDHVDLLVSSRYWPPVYVTDSARAVALCTDLRYPELGGPMWGRNQGCFSDPLDRPQVCVCVCVCVCVQPVSATSRLPVLPEGFDPLVL